MDYKEPGAQGRGHFLYFREKTGFLDRAEEILTKMGIEKLREDDSSLVMRKIRGKI